MRRICTQCKEEKPIGEFNFRDKKLGKRQGACRECTRNQVRRHIKANPEYYRERARRRKQMLFQENPFPCGIDAYSTTTKYFLFP